tara:strand:+ start:3864 stop:4061 length:198 start_codon:yes stop_codon:yes gene_type:complete
LGVSPNQEKIHVLVQGDKETEQKPFLCPIHSLGVSTYGDGCFTFLCNSSKKVDVTREVENGELQF